MSWKHHDDTTIERQDVMITPELISRINELSRKKRAEGLSEAEAAEQASLRRIYLDSIREQMIDLLDSIRVVDDPTEPELQADIEISHRLMDFQEEMRRPFADTEHIH